MQMLQFTREQLKSIADYIEVQVGITYPEANYYQLEGRLEHMMKRLGIANRDDLLALTDRGLFGAAKELLLDLATNNETFFFATPRSLMPSGASCFLGSVWCAPCRLD